MYVAKHVHDSRPPEYDSPRSLRCVELEIKDLPFVSRERIVKDRIGVGKVYGSTNLDRQHMRIEHLVALIHCGGLGGSNGRHCCSDRLEPHDNTGVVASLRNGSV